MNNSKGCLTSFILFCVVIYFLQTHNPIIFVLILVYAIIYSFNKRKVKNTIDKDIEKRMNNIEKDIENRKKLLTQLKERLKVNKNPDRTEEYKDITMKIYELDQETTAIQILNWEQEPLNYDGSLCTNIQKLHNDLVSLKRHDLIERLEEKIKDSDLISLRSFDFDLIETLNKRIKELNEVDLNTFYFDFAEVKNDIDSFRSYLKDKEEYLAQKEQELRKKESVHFLAKAYKQRKRTTTFKQNLTTIDSLFNLSPVEFEKWVKTNIFEKEGWKVSETKLTGDGGIDLILTKNGEHSIAQCKRFKNTVGEPLLRDFYGTMISEGVSRGYFVTTGLFSLSALKFTEGKPIEMIDRRVLAQKYL